LPNLLSSFTDLRIVWYDGIATCYGLDGPGFELRWR